MKNYQTIDDFHRNQGQRVNARPTYAGRHYNSNAFSALMTVIFVMFAVAGLLKFLF